MAAIPLHLQRIFEQRWAAKLASLAVSAAQKSTESNNREQLATPSKSATVADPGDELAGAG
jgi:hypothetical protein